MYLEFQLARSKRHGDQKVRSVRILTRKSEYVNDIVTSDIYRGTIADDMPIPMPESKRPIIIVSAFVAVALEKFIMLYCFIRKKFTKN